MPWDNHSKRPMDFGVIHCSPEAVEDLAEQFVFRRLSTVDMDQYEEHLLVCGECRSALEQVEDFIRTLRQAARP